MYRNCKCNCCWNNKNDNCDDNIETMCSNIPLQKEEYSDSCMCGFEEEYNPFPNNPMLGQSYVPWQTLNKTFIPEVGLKMGTIFPELVKPYCAGHSMEELSYLEQTNSIGKGCNK